MKAWFYHYKKAFTLSECEQVKAHAFTLNAARGTVGTANGFVVDERLRRCNVTSLKTDDPSVRFVYDRLALLANEANGEAFQLYLTNEPRLCHKDLQFLEYLSSEAGKYGWHSDVDLLRGETPQRKLSCCVQLSESAEYDGGKLELEGCELRSAFAEQGDVIYFPSFLRHRVTPITRGTRHALVNWYLGPPLA